MSTYDDYDRPQRRSRNDRPPYPPDPNDDFGDRRSRPTKGDSGASSEVRGGKSDIPPPPLGSAMKREGSRSRVPHLKPDFPDEASYLNGRGADAERKTGDRERRFRERREGYESDEGETLRGDMRRQRSQRERPRPPYDDGPRGSSSTLPVRGGPPKDRRREDDYEDRRRPKDYDDRPRRRREYDDDATDLPPRRRGPRSGVEYGADPVRPARRSDTGRSRYDDDDYDDDRARRRRSQPAARRGDRSDDDDDYDRGDRRRRREDDRDDRRRPARRRSHDDYDDYDDRRRRERRDDRDDRDRKDKKKEPTHMKIGNVDIGPAIDKGQKYYGSLAPLLTPIVMNYIKNKKGG